MIAFGSIGQDLPATCQISEILSQKRKNPNLGGMASLGRERERLLPAYPSHPTQDQLQSFQEHLNPDPS